jgi:hypothetical protein
MQDEHGASMRRFTPHFFVRGIVLMSKSAQARPKTKGRVSKRPEVQAGAAAAFPDKNGRPKKYAWFTTAISELEQSEWEKYADGHAPPSGPLWQRTFRSRDGEAHAHLESALGELGWSFSDTIQTVPLELPRDSDGRRIPPRRLIDAHRPLVWPQLSAAEMLLLATRPPLNDDDHPDLEDEERLRPGAGVLDQPKKYVARSYVTIEKQVLDATRPFFNCCHRRCISLRPPFVYFLAPTHAALAEAVFYQNRPTGEYQWLRALGDSPFQCTKAGKTACYLLYVPKIEGLNIPLLAAFGMSGNDTWRLARYLHKQGVDRLRDVLEKGRERLIVFELTDAPLENILQPSNCDNCTLECVLDLSIVRRVPDRFLDLDEAAAVIGVLAGQKRALFSIRGEWPRIDDYEPDAPLGRRLPTAAVKALAAKLEKASLIAGDAEYTLSYRRIDDHVPGRRAQVHSIVSLHRDGVPVLVSVRIETFERQGAGEPASAISIPDLRETYLLQDDPIAQAILERSLR